MIEADKRKAIFLLHQEGMELRHFAQRLKVSRNTVRAIIAVQGAMPESTRKDKIRIDPELLRRLHEECEGYGQRVHERLVEETGSQVAYPTLARMLRELEISTRAKARCAEVPDEPGAEMQHDTTMYQVTLAGQATRVTASLLYLRYSKRRYLKFYRPFKRFKMKNLPRQGDVDENFRQRDAYREGHVTEAPDLSAYDKMLENDDGCLPLLA